MPTRKFDLNIERVLQNWTVAHAIREPMAEALDEAALTSTAYITSPTRALRAALNRERSNVGRTAHTVRMKSLVLRVGRAAGRPSASNGWRKSNAVGLGPSVCSRSSRSTASTNVGRSSSPIHQAT